MNLEKIEPQVQIEELMDLKSCKKKKDNKNKRLVRQQKSTDKTILAHEQQMKKIFNANGI